MDTENDGQYVVFVMQENSGLRQPASSVEGDVVASHPDGHGGCEGPFNTKCIYYTAMSLLCQYLYQII